MRGSGAIVLLLVVAGGLIWYLFFRTSGPKPVTNTSWLDAFNQYESTIDKPLLSLPQASAKPSGSPASIDNSSWLDNFEISQILNARIN